MLNSIMRVLTLWWKNGLFLIWFIFDSAQWVLQAVSYLSRNLTSSRDISDIINTNIVV